VNKRLTRGDWINYGLKSLSKLGYKSLNAASLAQALGVSRGSFYWHFTNIADFELQLMNSWKQRTTESVITELENNLSTEKRLTKLVGLALSNEFKLDKAMRSWSMEDHRVSQIVTEVDNQRILYIESLFEAMMTNKKDVTLQAKVLYWSCIGKSVVEVNSKSTYSEADIKRLLKIFLN